MREIIDYLRTRYLSEKAQGMTEYALVLAFVVLVVAAVAGTENGLKTAITGAFDKVTTQINKTSL